MPAEDLFEHLLSQLAKQRRPPVGQWQPVHGGSIDIRICRDGYWYHEGVRIKRDAIVRLFASILRRDDDGYVLVTPAERLLIQVDDVPFVAIDCDVRSAGAAGGVDDPVRSEPGNFAVTSFGAAPPATELLFTTNVGDLVLADAAHPIWLSDDPDAVPYVRVRERLDARIARSVYYRLLEHAQLKNQVVCLQSAGCQFELAKVS